MSHTRLETSVIDVYVYPGELFETLKSEKSWLWLGLALLLVPAALSSYFFVEGMSVDWFVEQSLQQSEEMGRAEYENARAAIESSFPHAGKLTAIFVTLSFVITVLLSALYFKVVCFTHDEYRFQDWMNFSIWTNMPQLLNLLGFCAILVLSDTPNLPMNATNYASLNQLVLNLPAGHDFYLWADNLNLFYLWTVALSAIGLQCWCDYSPARAWLIGASPYVLIFGIWALMV